MTEWLNLEYQAARCLKMAEKPMELDRIVAWLKLSGIRTNRTEIDAALKDSLLAERMVWEGRVHYVYRPRKAETPEQEKGELCRARKDQPPRKRVRVRKPEPPAPVPAPAPHVRKPIFVKSRVGMHLSDGKTHWV